MDVQSSGINKFGMNYTPISAYNKMFESNSEAINNGLSNNSVDNFQNILDDQMMSIQNQDMNTNTYNAGVNMDVNYSGIDSNNTSAEAKENLSPVERTADGFKNAFSDGLNSLNQKQLDAQNAVETLASGGDISVHEVMIKSQKASLNMQMALQLRNKILSAYNELYQIRF